jgi:hypothetical protein
MYSMIDFRGGTLLMIGKATDAIVVAADSAGTWRSGEVESSTKIYPVGRFGAFLIRGNSAFAHRREPKGEVTEKLDLLQVVVPSLANANGTLASAIRAISKDVAAALRGFFSKTHSRFELNVHLILVGYDDGAVPSLHMAQLLGPADQTHIPNETSDTSPVPTSFVLPLGDAAVAKGILDGSLEAITGRARNVVQKHRSAPMNTNSAQMLRLFQVCLEATERDEVLGISVHPPNNFAIIRPDTGFAFRKPAMY